MNAAINGTLESSKPILTLGIISRPYYAGLRDVLYNGVGCNDGVWFVGLRENDGAFLAYVSTMLLPNPPTNTGRSLAFCDAVQKIKLLSAHSPHRQKGKQLN
jgi:hypothetical protein